MQGKATFELITDASGRTTIKVKKERAPTRNLILVTRCSLRNCRCYCFLRS